MKKIILFTVILLSMQLAVSAQSADEKAIRQSLNTQLQAWNDGDIPRFMQTYWNNDSLMFIGKSGVTYGWQPTLENYKKGYPDTAAMGKLDFNLLEFKRIAPDYYFVVGKWHLKRSIGDVGGHFTLLFRRIKGQWLIIADHSS